MKKQFIILIGIITVMASSAFTSYEKEKIEDVKVEKLSLDYTYDLTRKITAVQTETFIRDYVRIQDIMIANPQIAYISGDPQRLNPTGCPPDCSTWMDTSTCYTSYYKRCGAYDTYCFYCVYMTDDVWVFKTCAICHW